MLLAAISLYTSKVEKREDGGATGSGAIWEWESSPMHTQNNPDP